jgi:hypothetical protein
VPIVIDRGRDRHVRIPDLEEQLLDTVNDAPGRSVRGLASEFVVGRTTVHNILKQERYLPFRYT